jgi:O-methyltransferase
MKKQIKNLFRCFGLDIVRYRSPISDLSNEDQRIVSRVTPFTLTSVERVATLINAVTYVTTNDIPGDIAECGVWRGGSMMTVALVLLARSDTSRSLYLYDTFEGMTPPSDYDIRSDGIVAKSEFERISQENKKWHYAGLEDVRNNMLSTGYPEDKIHFIKGKIEETIPDNISPHLSILRLDTDFYESTKHELVHLFPLLDSKGVLIIDDYGWWQGSKKAVDEYFSEIKRTVYLHRIDQTGRILIKNGE